MDLYNCPNCNSLFVKTKFRDVCDACYKEEEAQFDRVYEYIRKKSNRTASMVQVVEATGVEEELIIKFVKTGKLRIAQFPNLGIPCEKCGTVIRSGRLCETCSASIRSGLETYESDEKRRLEIQEREKKNTYFMKEQ